MSFVEINFINLTSQHICFQLKDTLNATSTEIEIGDQKSKAIKASCNEYEIKITKVNNLSTENTYLSKLTESMAFIEDEETKEVHLIDCLTQNRLQSQAQKKDQYNNPFYLNNSINLNPNYTRLNENYLINKNSSAAYACGGNAYIQYNPDTSDSNADFVIPEHLLNINKSLENNLSNIANNNVNASIGPAYKLGSNTTANNNDSYNNYNNSNFQSVVYNNSAVYLNENFNNIDLNLNSGAKNNLFSLNNSKSIFIDNKSSTIPSSNMSGCYSNINAVNDFFNSKPTQNALVQEPNYKNNFNKFNSSVYLNSDQLQYAMEKPKSDQIKLINYNHNTIYCRISADKEVNNHAFILASQQMQVFEVKINHIYQLHICNNYDMFGGVVFLVKANRIYKFDQSNNLLDFDDNTVGSLANVFNPLFLMQYGQYETDQDTIILSHLDDKSIIIMNKSLDIVCCKIKTTLGTCNSSNEFLEIEPLSYVIYKREKGNYSASIIYDKGGYTHKYLLETKVCYEIVSKTNCLINSLTKQKAEVIFSNSKILCNKNNQAKCLKANINLNNINTQQHEYFDAKKPNYTQGKFFLDDDFPPNSSSIKAFEPRTGRARNPHFIHVPSDQLNEEDRDKIFNLNFARAAEIFKGQPTLFDNEIFTCNQSNYGFIGSNYLINAISLLSKRPDFIKAIFKTQNINPDGFYELFFYENGKKKLIFIDDYLAYDKHIMPNDNYLKKNLFFVKPTSTDLWLLLLHKAYAKFEGGFMNTFGGTMARELEWLTGGMSRIFPSKNPHAWCQIKNALKTNYIVTCATNFGNENISNFNTTKNIFGNQFVILSAKEYRKIDKNIRLLKMKFLLGQSQWKGDYSHHSDLWNNELKSFFGFENEKPQDGIFFISLEDFAHEFSVFSICCIEI